MWPCSVLESLVRLGREAFLAHAPQFPLQQLQFCFLHNEVFLAAQTPAHPAAWEGSRAAARSLKNPIMDGMEISPFYFQA